MLKYLKRQKWIWLDRIVLRRLIRNQKHKHQLKLILGAGRTQYSGWIATDYPVFDIFKSWQWSFLLKGTKLDNILIEHVLEHFTERQVGAFLKLTKKYLKPNGIIRIAVPDGFHPNPDYIEFIKPGGSGPGADDHKMLWNYKNFSKIANENGLQVRLLEYYDENGEFKSFDYDQTDGIITRTRKKQKGLYDFDYSSLVLDLVVGR